MGPMGGDPGDRSFWETDCPERAVGLHHAHWSECQPGRQGHPGTGETHVYGQCCHCKQTAQEFHEAQQRQSLAPTKAATCPPHIFWLGRCTQCGKPPADERDDVLVEPKFVTGNGPTGPLRGQERLAPPAYGRGPFTQENYARLMFFCTIVRDPTPEVEDAVAE